MFALWRTNGKWEIIGPFKNSKTLEVEIELQGRNLQEVFVVEANPVRHGGKFPDNPLRQVENQS